MELELNRMDQGCYEPVLETTVCREETLEMIVPDACPDILRIADTEGHPCLTGKEAGEGSVQLNGSVKAAILYLPDGMEGLWKLDAEVPFQCGMDHSGVHGDCRVVAVPRVTGAETRIINPRKVLVRVNLSVFIQVYAPRTMDICDCVAGGEEWGVQQRQQRCEGNFVVCVEEKSFAFSDELTIPGSKPPAAGLLKGRGSVYCSESKIIGSKLILKGGVSLQFLCRGTDAALYTANFELPFSQIMEVSGTGEDGTCQIQVVLTDWSFGLSGEDGRAVSVSLELLAQAVVREDRRFDIAVDAYSTAYPLTAEFKNYQLAGMVEQGSRRQTVRELIETGVAVKNVYDSRLSVGQISVDREGGSMVLTAETTITVLFSGEEEGVSSISRQIPVKCQMELPEGCQVSCLCFANEVSATAAAGGMEVRFTLDFQITALRQNRLAGISALQLDETTQRDSSADPSIVLRKIGAEESLWDVAKTYSTTMEEIIRANELEGEQVAVGQLLLIPKKRT